MPRIIVALFVATLAASPASAVQKYIAKPLGSLGSLNSTGTSIDNSGEVAGNSGFASTNYSQPFLYSRGVMNSIPTSGGIANGINDNGQVTGYTFFAGINGYHAYLYSQEGSVLDLGTLGGTSSVGYAVNKNGWVTGTSGLPGDQVGHAFLYSGSAMTDLGTLGGPQSYGRAINGSGQVAGYSNVPNMMPDHAFLYSNGAMQDLGTLGGHYSAAYGINDSGQVTGYSYDTGDMHIHAFLYSGGTMQDLGTLGGLHSFGASVNASGQVVGTADTSAGPRHGFLYSDGTMYDLNDLIVSGLGTDTLYDVQAINDSGQIVANGCHDSRCQAYRLDPVVGPGLVYEPLDPCRIMDTRNATPDSGVQGPLVGDTLYLLPGYVATGADWQAYGQVGTPSDCGLNNSVGERIHAIAMVITILHPNFDAFLGIGDIYDMSMTLSTVALNYTADQGVSTLYMVPQTSRNTIYFALPTGLSADLIFDVVGYIVTSDATALQCTAQASAPSTIGASGGTGSATSPACGAGYALSSGSCDSDSFATKLVSDKASGQGWLCSAINSGGADAHLTATANCCRVAGK